MGKYKHRPTSACAHGVGADYGASTAAANAANAANAAGTRRLPGAVRPRSAPP